MEPLAEVERRAFALKARIRALGRPLTLEERRAVGEEATEIREQLGAAMVERLVTNRPEVVTHGRPRSGQAARRGQHEARRRLRERREFRSACSACPAAAVGRRADGEVNVRCAVEGSLLSSATDPQSVLTFCMGSYESCPSWVAEKEALEAGRAGAAA